MSDPWKVDQILGLAPDSASAKAGQGLSTPAKWVNLGQNEQALWGECLGSGSSPYQTQIDLSEPAFKCSCPSRKFPCKHALGLFLMLGPKVPATVGSPPDWVTKWLQSRQEKGQTKKEKVEKPDIVDPEAQAKRAAERAKKVSAGIEELRTWLFDLVRSGLAQIPSGSRAFEQPSARLIDAQAPGAARWVRDLDGIAHAGPHWPMRLLAELSGLFLLTEAYQKIDRLPPETQADVRAHLGFAVREEEILQGEPVRDVWQVQGQSATEEDRLKVHRTWLRGRRTQRPALILAFAPVNLPLKHLFVGGTEWEGDLVFHPSGYPLRAILKERLGETTRIKDFSGQDSVAILLNHYSQALARQPWINRFPASLNQVVPVRHEERLYLRDQAGLGLPVRPNYPHGWELLSLSGGHPMDLFAEFDGKALTPLCAFCQGDFHDLA